MKKYAPVLILIFIVALIYFRFFVPKRFEFPEEYKLDVTHVSDLDESLKYSNQRIGGHCHLASTTMMLKSFDPNIEFWRVFIARGNSTSFNYYFPNGRESEIQEGLDGKGTAMALKAISNMGYLPHIRLRGFLILDKNNWWVQVSKEVGGDVKTYWLNSPMDEYKSVIVSGIPLVTSGSSCWQDYNVIEGYSKDKLFVVVPDPDDQDRTDPEISCSLGIGLQNEVFWATPQSRQIQHDKILSEMKSYALYAPKKILEYANYLDKGSSIANFEIEKLYLARLLTAKYLNERSYLKLAAGYGKSASLLQELIQFEPRTAGEHKEKIITNMKLLGENEKSLIEEWNNIESN